MSGKRVNSEMGWGRLSPGVGKGHAVRAMSMGRAGPGAKRARGQRSMAGELGTSLPMGLQEGQWIGGWPRANVTRQAQT